MTDKKGISILDSMVAETLATVGEKAPKRSLTPLAGERGADTPLPTTPQPFPNDVPTEVVIQKATELTRIIAHLTEARDALQSLVGLHEEDKTSVDEQIKQKEAAADARAEAKSKRAKVVEAMADHEVGFPERFSALQEEAISATFGWRCSVHPDASPASVTSPKGREFHRCTVDGCKQFER